MNKLKTYEIFDAKLTNLYYKLAIFCYNLTNLYYKINKFLLPKS